jgi:4-amino-4-deoxy-L-arabinose transferase-like glycosyltransferase
VGGLSFPLARQHLSHHSQRYALTLVALVVIGVCLRLPLLDRFPLREDEAIYSYWALHFGRADPFFLQVWPDKPPLFLWLLTATFEVAGASQASARGLNVVLSVLTIPVIAALARQLSGPRAGLVAALFFSLNPFVISFAPTAFTDPLLVLAGTLAAYFALRPHPLWAGFWLGAAIMTKQQGVLYLPLVIGLLCCAAPRDRWLAQLGLSLMGLVLVVGPVIYWDSLRWDVAPSPWDLGTRNYQPLALLSPADWPGRAWAWGRLGWYVVGSWLGWLALLGLLVSLLWPLVSRPSLENSSINRYTVPTPTPTQKQSTSGSRSRRGRLSTYLRRSGPAWPWLIIVGWAGGFGVLHLVTNVPVWDRYLLPLTPVLALLAGGLTAQAIGRLPSSYQLGVLAVGVLVLTPPALSAAQGRLPVGGDHGDYAGLTEALIWLQQTHPDAVVLYHQKLGWHYRFYLYEEMTEGTYELRWFPSAVYLADNAAKTPHRTKVLITPPWSPVRDLELQAKVRGLQLQAVGRFGQFTLFTITQRPKPACTWCLCPAASSPGLSSPWPTLHSSTGSSPLP